MKKAKSFLTLSNILRAVAFVLLVVAFIVIWMQPLIARIGGKDYCLPFESVLKNQDFYVLSIKIATLKGVPNGLIGAILIGLAGLVGVVPVALKDKKVSIIVSIVAAVLAIVAAIFIFAIGSAFANANEFDSSYVKLTPSAVVAAVLAIVAAVAQLSTVVVAALKK